MGAVAVMVDEETLPPAVLLVEHSYRRKGAWGLPGGALDSIAGDPVSPGSKPSPDDVIESALRREVWEELGLEVTAIRLLRVDAIPYVAEEPGPYRLDFYFRCEPRVGFAALRADLASGKRAHRSPEISQMRLVPFTELGHYDLFSADARFLNEDLRRLEPALFARDEPNLLPNDFNRLQDD